ncbi:MAG: hypothetical protein OK422_06730 [Thaumarchaeota archaeon]|nr:hypothetical protein [Nitrososphaerota archaeon]
MTETIKVELEEALAKRFRKKAMERYGYKKGAVKMALEEVIKKFVASGEVNWEPYRGSLESGLGSVELQHSALRKID